MSNGPPSTAQQSEVQPELSLEPSSSNQPPPLSESHLIIQGQTTSTQTSNVSVTTSESLSSSRTMVVANPPQQVVGNIVETPIVAIPRIIPQVVAIHHRQANYNPLPPPSIDAPPSYANLISGGFFTPQSSPQVQPISTVMWAAPPPTYAEALGFQAERPLIIASVDHVTWGPESLYVICPQCAHLVLTTTTVRPSNITHFTCISLFLCGCWPCCFIPYCIPSCTNIYHYCSNCNNYLGMYSPG